MNVIEIVSDTLRRDYLGCYGNDWVHTENLDDFATSSLVFDKAYIASFPTIPHRRDLFTGRYSFVYSKWLSRGPVPNLPREEIILSELLRQTGYATMLIADTYHMIRDIHGFDRGFDGWWWIRGQEHDRFMTSPSGQPEERRKAVGTQYLRNVSLRRFESDYFVAQTMTSASKWLELNYDKHDKFLLHVDTFDPHEPWDPPKWYVDMYDPDWKGSDIIGGAYVEGKPDRQLAGSLSKDELDHLRALYAGEVTLVDRWVGMLLEKIEDLGLFEDTAVIFTTDHGTYHGEHGYIRKCPHLYEEVAHIPLMIRIPDSADGQRGRCNSLVQPPDLMPTILELAGAPRPPTVQGRSLVPLLKGESLEERDVVVSSASLIEKNVVHSNLDALRITATSKDWALIWPRSDAPPIDDLGVSTQPELYYLPADPKQVYNIYKEEEEVARNLHAKMIQFLKVNGTNTEILDHWR